MVKAGVFFLAVILIVCGCISARAEDEGYSDEWMEDLFGGWMTEKPEAWQSEEVDLWPDVAKMIKVAYPGATEGSARAQLYISYFVIITQIGGPELIAPVEAKLGLKFSDLEHQTMSWKKSIIYGDDRRAATISAGLFVETERALMVGGLGNLELQKCWEKAFLCFKDQRHNPLADCRSVATQILDQKAC